MTILAVAAVSSASELETLVKEAQETSPLVLVARAQVEQALQKHRELTEFFDIDFFAALGKADNQRDLPIQSGYTELTDKAIDAQLGLQVPIEPGAYVALGGARRLLTDPPGYDELYQTMYGVRVRVPLLRDRGFRNYNLNRAIAMAEYNAAISHLLAVTQDVRHSVEIAYIAAYEALSAYRISQGATKRFQGLLDEALALDKLQAIPSYQIFHAQLELQIGKDDEEKARNNFAVSLVNLANTIGVTRTMALAGDQSALLNAAAGARELTLIPEDLALEARGNYLTAKNEIERVRLQLETSLEAQNDDINLYFGVTVQGEDPHKPWEMHELTTDRRVGGEVAIVWRRKFDYRGDKAREAQFRIRIGELNESLRKQALDIHQELETALLQHRAASHRLDLVEKGIEAAKKHLAAELERFSLGENSSNNVTDAQKNLTTILQRQSTATADLLRAKAKYLHATGYRLPAEATPVQNERK
ncbi:MAG: TolC family protein [Victivallales bacterium]|nr:TolC family protein [Victivallales bacterium]